LERRTPDLISFSCTHKPHFSSNQKENTAPVGEKGHLWRAVKETFLPVQEKITPSVEKGQICLLERSECLFVMPHYLFLCPIVITFLFSLVICLFSVTRETGVVESYKREHCQVARDKQVTPLRISTKSQSFSS
jgi:hypothetical protein